MTDPVVEHARRMIRAGSKSFFAAARLFDGSTRESAYLLYAWCRHCDDRIDQQELGHAGSASVSSPARALARLELETGRALAGGPVSDPVFEGLRRVVERHQIPRELPFELLEGFRMDVEGRTYHTLDEALRYCYHVAGVVGVMMARVMGIDDEETLDRACDLGLAFQITNIARDVMEDAASDRVYLPLEWLEEAGVAPRELGRQCHRQAVFGVTRRFLEEAERYYASSEAGIARLRPRHAWAIAAARRVYREIGRSVLARGARAWDRRAVVSRSRKLWLLSLAALDAAVATRAGSRPTEMPRQRLWTRPRPGSA